MKRSTSPLLSTWMTALLVFTLITGCAGEDTADLGYSASDSISGPAAAGEPGTWLVLLYQDADDETLERDIFYDLNEAEIAGSTNKVTIISQIDRYDGEFEGDGDWISTKRFLVNQGFDLETIESEELADLGEVDMSDPQTLVDFATWAIRAYPAEHIALVMSDHGMGWLGGWTDPDPNDGDMSLAEIDGALATIINETGIGQFEFFGFDACLMAQLEAMSALAPYARYAVASEETEPAMGWAYASFLTSLVENPDMDGAEMARLVVDSYVSADYRITDDAARAAFIEENYDNGQGMSAEDVATDMSQDITLSAIDLSSISPLNLALNEFVQAIGNADQSSVAAARSYSQSYTSVFDKGIPDSFIDLGHFVQLAADESGDEAVAAAAQNVMDWIDQAVISEKHGDLRSGSTGLAFYFPNSKLFSLTTDEEFGSYTAIANRFAAASLWDDYLVFHYTEKPINIETVDLSVLDPVSSTSNQDFSEAIDASALEVDAVVESPGLGDITVSEVTVSAEELAPGESVSFSADISGSNIGYVYYYINYYFEEDDSYVMADMGYLFSEYIKDVGGLVYPDWGEGETFTVDSEWLPTVYFLTNGEEESFAYLEPETFGESYEDDVYTLYGLFAPGGDTSREQEAMIRFDGNFAMKSFWVFTGEDGTGAPREATLEPGDTFSTWQLWEEYNSDLEEWEYVYYLGDPVTYWGDRFEIISYDAYSGLYEVGIMAEDYDGNFTSSFANVTILE